MREIIPPKIDVGRPEQWLSIAVFDRTTLSLSESPLKRIPTTDDLLIAYTAEGEPRAISARCPHHRLPLIEYAQRGQKPGTILCTAHRCEFDIASGHCLAAPGVRESVPALQSWRLVASALGSWQIDTGPEEEA